MKWDKEKIRAFRKKKLGLTQYQFAEVIGTSQDIISNWETGKSNPCSMSQKFLTLLVSKDIKKNIEEILSSKQKENGRISVDTILAFREKLSLSQTEFARLLGRNHSTVSYWESGEKSPGKESFLLLKKLASKEGIDLEKLDTEVKEVSLDSESVGKQNKGKTNDTDDSNASPDPSDTEDCDTDSSETSNRGGANFTTASPADQNGFSPDPDIKKVVCGIDILYLSYYVEVNEKLMSALEAAKAEAEDKASKDSGKAEVPIDIGDYTFNIKSYGHPRYAYILSNGDLWLQVAKENTESYPCLYVQMNSLYVLETSADSAVEQVRSFISLNFGEITKEIVSRVEMYVDIAGAELTQEDQELFVSRAKDCDIHIKDDAFTGFSFGKGDIKAKVYNKTLEIKKSHKEYMYDIWEDVSEDEEVWRIEFSLSRRALREWGVEAFESFKEIAGDIWKYLTEDWLSMREQDNENPSRRSLTLLWEEVCSTREFFGKVTGAVRNNKRIGEIEHNISVIKGCYTSIGANFYNMGVDMSFDGVSTLVTTGIKERLAGKYGDSDLSEEDIEALSPIGFAQEVYRKAVYA